MMTKDQVIALQGFIFAVVEEQFSHKFALLQYHDPKSMERMCAAQVRMIDAFTLPSNTFSEASTVRATVGKSAERCEPIKD